MSGRRVWVVLPDLLSIRVFFDTGILDGLRERLGGGIEAVFLIPPADAESWRARLGDTPVTVGDDLTAVPPGPTERLARRADDWLDPLGHLRDNQYVLG